MIGFQLSPNPASSIIKVSYNLEDENSTVNIKLYNMMGELIAGFDPQNRTEGEQQYEIDLASLVNSEALQNGVYLCALSLNGEIQTKKFMLVK